jgi:hypothetical protein
MMKFSFHVVSVGFRLQKNLRTYVTNETVHGGGALVLDGITWLRKLSHRESMPRPARSRPDGILER